MTRETRRLLALIYGSIATLTAGTALYGPSGPIARFSFRTLDEPVAPGIDARPLLGGHYFGDWQLFVGWGAHPDPYSLRPLGFNGLPPSLWFFQAMARLPLEASLLVLVALSVTVTFAATWLLLPEWPPVVRAIAWLAGFGLSAGFLSSLDRGAMQAVVVGLAGIWLWALRDRPVVAGLLLALAITFKPYMAVLLLWPIVHRLWRTAAVTVGSVTLGSLAGFLLLPGGLTNVSAYLGASSFYTRRPDEGEWERYSVGLWRLWTDLPPMLPGALYGALVLLAIVRRRDTVALVLLLSTTQLAWPLSQAYTALWAGLAIVLLVRERLSSWPLWAALTVTIVPLPFLVGGQLMPGFAVPIVCLLVAVCALNPRALRQPETQAPTLTPILRPRDARTSPV